MRINFLRTFVLFSIFFFANPLFAENPTFSEAEKLFNNGRYGAAADLLNPVVNSGENVEPKVYMLYGKCLDNMTEEINTAAERKCYRSAGATHSPKCMYSYATRLNEKYGAGSFEYVHNIITIKYSGVHFVKAETGGDKDVAAESAYYELTKNLIGHPSVVLPGIREFLKKYPGGKWNRKGQLLYARINEDVWWIHRNWAWLLYDWNLSAEDLVVRAEPYRQEAIRAFKRVKGGEEGKAARRELKLLKKYKSDGKVYGIINESSVEGVNVDPGKKAVE